MGSDYLDDKLSDTSSIYTAGGETEAGPDRQVLAGDERFRHQLGPGEDEPGEWQILPLKEKWENVLMRLRTGEAQWQSLRDCEKQALAARDTGAEEGDRTSATVLHLLAKKFSTHKFDELEESTRMEIIKYLLDQREHSSPQHTSPPTPTSEHPVLTLAMQSENKAFTDHVFRNTPSYGIMDLIDAHDHRDVKSTNCLHYAFAKKLPLCLQKIKQNKNQMTRPTHRTLDLDETLKLIRKIIENAKPESIAARDYEGNTPLHYALDYHTCSRLGRSTGKFSKYREILGLLVEKGDELRSRKGSVIWFNKADESPYRYHLRTEKEMTPKQSSHPAGSTSKPLAKTASESAKGIERASKVSQKGTQDTREVVKDGATGAKQKKNSQLSPSAKAWAGSPSATAGRRWTSLAGISHEKGETTQEQTAPDLEGSNRLLASAEPKAEDTSANMRLIPIHNPVPTEVEGTSGDKETETENRNQAHKGRDGKADQALLKAEKEDERNKKSRAAMEKLQTWLKTHYIRTRTDMDAKELLYGKVASDKNLYFDASHLEGKGPDEVVRLIEMLHNAGGFEDTLSYVRLPSLSIEQDVETTSNDIGQPYAPNHGRQRSGKKRDNPMLGRKSLIKVFDKLWSVGVGHVIQLHVDDTQTPHTDDAIEKAIQGEENPLYRRPDDTTTVRVKQGRKKHIQVDMWNWQKIDLDVSVIIFAAPAVEEIHLYWSGNSTVLSSWACNEGIKRLHTIHLHAFPGLESSWRLDGAIRQFQQQIEQINDSEGKGIEVKVKRLRANGPRSSKSDELLRPLDAMDHKPPPEHDWINSMESFRSELIFVHRDLGATFEPQRVKVALIDDGIDLGDLQNYDIPNGVRVTGISYCEPIQGTVLARPWHQSTQSHGTIMANMILRINPWASLYVMRIQQESGIDPSGQSLVRIHARSAAKAIRGAILLKVNIISMSWTIHDLNNQTTQNTGDQAEVNDLNDLRKAIKEAKEQKIIMFCSASDKVQQRGSDYLPFNADKHYLFRIGSAGHGGQPDVEVGDQTSISWFFPGNKVAAPFNPRSSKILEHHDGSSVSTALAAGFASLIMYLANVMSEYHRSRKTSSYHTDNAEYFDKVAKLLGQRNCMNRAFTNLRDETFQDRKFLPVWNTFGKKATNMWKMRMESCTSSKDVMSFLDELVRVDLSRSLENDAIL